MDGDQALGGFSSEGLAKIPPALQAVVDAGDLSGFVTLLWRKGEIAQVNAVGLRDIEAGKPMTRDTLFRIASMTKPVTSIAALMLMEEGKLKLDDPITKWVPELANMKVLKAADGPLDAVSDSPRDITVEDLMTHRSGLAYGFTSVGPIAQAHEAVLGPPLGPPHTPDSWLAALGTLPLSYPPGERFHYSHATEVLGFIVARIDGKSLGQSLRERILAPLGMTDTDFWVPPEKRDRMAKLYRARAEGGLEDRSLPHTDEPPAFEAGGGGLVSTADDYLKFARMMLNGGELDGVRIVKPQTIALMGENRLTPAQRQIPFMGFPFWAAQGFGLGVSVIMDPQIAAMMGGTPSAGSFGWPGAFGTWWQADPGKDMILIYLIQNSMDLSPEAASQLATGQRMGGRMALPTFQTLAHAAVAT
jgi:CubicO group peptidase (beta-lactamase class C family)